VSTRIDWKPIIEQAAQVVLSYGTRVTLRQLHYRLVSISELRYPNTTGAYKRLSDLTATARRAGDFPALSDLTRSIEVPPAYVSPREALRDLAREYRRDRTEGQPLVPVILAEKETLLAQLYEWFGDPLGVAIMPLRGYASESYEREISSHLAALGRASSALYLGDFDSSGEDIERNAQRHVGRWFEGGWERVALTPQQVSSYGLPENPGKATDSRSRGFAARHGRLVQVEVEALDPDDLRRLIQAAIDVNWDASEHEAVMEREKREREALQKLAEGL
jgi:hypothetical protein